MPLYEYQCDACAQRFEIIQKFSDSPPESCRLCGRGPVQRLLSSPAIQFKGTGWYITDYSQKGKSGAEGSTDTPKSDGKETKSTADAGSGDGAKPAAPASSTAPAKTDAPSKST